MPANRKDRGTEPFVKINEAAERAGLKVQTLYQYASDDKVPYWKYRGYHLRFLISDIDAWVVGELKGGFRGHVPAGSAVA